MYIFKEIIGVIIRGIGSFCFGFAINRLFVGDYKCAAWILFAMSILFMIGYFVERYSK